MASSRVMPTNRGVPRCARCDDPVSLRSGYQEVVGLVDVGRRAGGANAVRLPKPTGRWFCKPCVDFLVLKRPDTGELFPREPGA
jgi:hypothetical protein